MEIFISNTSDKPLYEQITAQIKNLILNGRVKGRGRPAFNANLGQGVKNQCDYNQASL